MVRFYILTSTLILILKHTASIRIIIGKQTSTLVVAIIKHSFLKKIII